MIDLFSLLLSHLAILSQLRLLLSALRSVLCADPLGAQQVELSVGNGHLTIGLKEIKLNQRPTILPHPEKLKITVWPVAKKNNHWDHVGTFFPISATQKRLWVPKMDGL